MESSYDKSKWIYIPDKDTDYRYILGTVGKHPLFVVGINPSTARPSDPDHTIQSVERIAKNNGFDSYITLNVYAQRATNPNDMDKEINVHLHEENLKAIESVFKACTESPVIWAAWGTLLNKRKYLADCLVDVVALSDKYNAKWCKVGKVSKDGHPHHPLYLKKDSVIEEFDIIDYLSKLKGNESSLEGKWERDSLKFERITNDDLVCKDCLFKMDDDKIFGNTSRCEIFQDCKPSEVLYGKSCSEYIKE